MVDSWIHKSTRTNWRVPSSHMFLYFMFKHMAWQSKIETIRSDPIGIQDVQYVHRQPTGWWLSPPPLKNMRTRQLGWFNSQPDGDIKLMFQSTNQPINSHETIIFLWFSYGFPIKPHEETRDVPLFSHTFPLDQRPARDSTAFVAPVVPVGRGSHEKKHP